MSKLLRSTLAAAVVVVSLSGCSGGDDGDRKPAPKESVDPDRTSPSDLPEVPQIKDFEGAVKDVKVGDCPVEKGDNTVTGSVKNPTDDPQDYVITISWVTPRSDVVGRGVATIKDLAPGESEKWKVTGTLERSGSYSCTTQVQRGQL